MKRYLVFAKRAALAGICLNDIARMTNITDEELETITFGTYDQESGDGVDIEELSPANQTIRDEQKALGKMPTYSGGIISYTQTNAEWKTAVEPEYPDMFIVPAP